MRGPMFKIVDDSERLRKPRHIRKPNRWDKIAAALNQDKTVEIRGAKSGQSIYMPLRTRNLLVSVSGRGKNIWVVWKKGNIE